ncbi:hypothetical protein B0A48_02326 [Cryoendolithus antarcticus]|uniref:Large ribosomal subunit protein uL30m n=1 Tax=Cryoendolithus antarcticus TaxID=1507870 RepID=A0A1V8TNT0_9PEZI|nr:hypothetical protein B0A48_02326 [Cryoendolithus antarcticus]
MSTATASRYFRITLLRSAIGLPSNNLRILKSLGLHKRLRTVYHPVSPDVAGKIFAVKELVDVSEVNQKLSPGDMRELRRPERGELDATLQQDYCAVYPGGYLEASSLLSTTPALDGTKTTIARTV